MTQMTKSAIQARKERWQCMQAGRRVVVQSGTSPVDKSHKKWPQTEWLSPRGKVCDQRIRPICVHQSKLVGGTQFAESGMGGWSIHIIHVHEKVQFRHGAKMSGKQKHSYITEGRRNNGLLRHTMDWGNVVLAQSTNPS